FLYVVKARIGYTGFSVVVLNRPGVIHETYTFNDGSFGLASEGKIAVDQQYIYVTSYFNVIRFNVGDPNSGVSIYDGFEVTDVKILPNDHLLVASSYAIDEITNDGGFVRNAFQSKGHDFLLFCAS